MDSTAASDLFGRLDHELWVVTARAGTLRGGLIATFVSHASLHPAFPRVLVGIAQQHQTWRLIRDSGAFALHLIDEEQIDWVWRFGLVSGRTADKFAGLTVREGVTGSPLLDAALGWLDCQVEATLDTGDRTIFLGEVVDARAVRSGRALTLKRMLELAPAARLQELKAHIEHDRAVDAHAIAAWRRDQPSARSDAPTDLGS